MSGVVQALGEAIEERRPTLERALIEVARMGPALLEAHLGPAVSEIGEDDRDQLVRLLAGLIGERQHEACWFDDLAIDPAPLTFHAVVMHRRLPPAAWADVHRDAVDRDVGFAAAEPVGEPLGLGPLAPQALAWRLEHATELQPALSR